MGRDYESFEFVTAGKSGPILIENNNNKKNMRTIDTLKKANFPAH